MRKTTLIIVIFFIQCQEILTVPNISFEQVTILSPLDRTTVNQETIQFLWTEIPHVEHYRLQLIQLRDSLPQELVFDTLISGINYRDSIAINGAYQFKIRGENSGYVTPYTVSNFQLNLPDINTATTQLLSPKVGAEISTGNTLFSWENITLASQYRFQLAQPNFIEASSLLIDSLIQVPQLRHILQTTGDFSWRVRGENSTGVSEYFEGNFKYTDRFLEEEITLAFPQTDQILTNTNVRFRWNEVSLAEQYQLQIVRPNFNTIEAFILDTIVSNPQLTYSLPDQNAYNWRVRALKAAIKTDYTSSNFSIAVHPSVASSTINLLAPSNGSSLNNTSVNFNWEAIEGASQYHIQVATPRFNNANQILVDQYTNEPFITATLVATSTYEWRVRAENNHSVSAYSSAQFLIQ